VQTFEARVLRAFREDPADLVIVDIATNDVNAVFFIHFKRRTCRFCGQPP
jgi:hypothetical protein